MTVKIRQKWLSNCNGEELQQLNRLRFKGDSMMYEDVILAVYQRDRIRVFLAEEEKHIIGWSCALLPPDDGETIFYPVPEGSENAPVYTYVARSHRKTGLGKRLLRNASGFVDRQGYTPTVFFYDEKSSVFFANLMDKIPALEVCDIDEWWDIFDEDYE